VRLNAVLDGRVWRDPGPKRDLATRGIFGPTFVLADF
jgi:hypothetical protein